MILTLEGDEPNAELEAALAEVIAGHEDHAWRQVGRCVYCEDGTRLYQGTIPKGHAIAPEPRKGLSASDRMRELWGKV